MSGGDLINPADIQRIARQGSKFYETSRRTYEPSHRGKLLAVDMHSEDAFVAQTSCDAVSTARAAQPLVRFEVARVSTALVGRHGGIGYLSVPSRSIVDTRNAIVELALDLGY